MDVQPEQAEPEVKNIGSFIYTINQAKKPIRKRSPVAIARPREANAKTNRYRPARVNYRS